MSITQETSPAGAAGPAGDDNHRVVAPAKPKRRRTGIVAAVVVVVVAAGGVSYVVIDPFHKAASSTSIDSGASTGIAQIKKGDLHARTQQNGTLGYAGTFEIINQAGGTATRLPKVGDIVKQGQVLYRVDGKAVIFLKGTRTPSYRDLSWGDTGADVKQLNAALVKLGYASKSNLDPSSDYFGRATYNAIVKLQDKLGLDETGKWTREQGIFLPADAIRVTKVDGVEGKSVPNGQTLIEGTTTDRQITVNLSASQQSQVKVGDATEITMPNGKTTTGKVTSVGKVATTDDNGTTIQVLIRPDKPAVTGSLDAAPVQVGIISDTAKGVLSVPVNALLALAGGGYAVEVVDASGAHRLVGVQTGLFDDSAGLVEVTGTGLATGQNVVVPAS